MKLVRITFRFEFWDAVEAILDENEITDFTRVDCAGRDRDGKHYGSKVFPGRMMLVEALVEDDATPDLLAGLRAFRESKKAQEHMRAAVIEVGEQL